MAAHRTTGEPVLPSAESAQLISMTPLQPPDFVIQNDFWVHGGIPDIDHCSVKFSILDDVDSVEQMRAVFHGSNPNILMVGEADGESYPVFMEYVNKILTLLTTLGRVDIVLLYKATEVDSAQFLMAAIKLKDKLPLLLFRWGSAIA